MNPTLYKLYFWPNQETQPTPATGHHYLAEIVLDEPNRKIVYLTPPDSQDCYCKHTDEAKKGPFYEFNEGHKPRVSFDCRQWFTCKPIRFRLDGCIEFELTPYYK